jgi:hypothetical protein
MEKLLFSSDPTLKASFHSRHYDSSGWLESYAIELEALDFHVQARVGNPGYGHPPSQLFEEIAVSWTGWEGTKSWFSMEGELELEATSDRTGHVTLTVAIPASANQRQWSARVAVTIEAGQLERLAEEAGAFFERRDASQETPSK